MTTSDAVYRAISDPTRRRILDLLARGERSAGDIGGEFRMTQPAVSQHLRVLREAGLVRARRDARSRIYSIDAEPLGEVRDWLAHLERRWLKRLQNAEEFGVHGPGRG